MSKPVSVKPTAAFIGAAWCCLFIGMIGYALGLYNATIALNEKGYYLAILMFGLFGAVSLQKSVRDRAENIPVTGIYFGICWFALLAALTMLAVGLWNASFLLSEKGFYAMAYILSLFAAVTVQKNIRDIGLHDADGTTADGFE